MPGNPQNIDREIMSSQVGSRVGRSRDEGVVEVPENFKKKNVIIGSADGHRKGKEGSLDEWTSGSREVKNVLN